MPGSARQFDSEEGMCLDPELMIPVPRSGELSLSYSPNVMINGRQSVRLGDKGLITGGPHAGMTFTVMSASGDVNVNSRGKARLGDETVCDVCGLLGMITSGSGNVNTN